MEAVSTQEDFGFGNYRCWLGQHEIAVIFGAGDMRPAAIDAWSEAIISTVNTFPGAGAVYLLVELNQPNQGFTAYTRHKALEIYQNTSDERIIYVAVLLRNTLTNLIITSFINFTQVNQLKPNLCPQIFTSRELALAWLRRIRQQENN